MQDVSLSNTAVGIEYMFYASKIYAYYYYHHYDHYYSYYILLLLLLLLVIVLAQWLQTWGIRTVKGLKRCIRFHNLSETYREGVKGVLLRLIWGYSAQ